MSASEIASGPQESDFLALIATLWRRKLLIGACTAVATVVAVVLALVATPKYRAEAVLTEVQDKTMGSAASLLGQFGGLANLAGLNLPSAQLGQELRGVLRSRRLVEEFVRRNDLVKTMMPTSSKPATLWMAVSNFRESVMTVKEDVRKGTLTVSVEWKDPATAARWANGLVALANELIRASAIQEASRNVDYLNKQIAATNVVEMQRVMYSLIESETKTLMLANAREEYAFKVIDPAVPPELRISPQRRLMVIVGFVLGLSLACGGVLLHDWGVRRRLWGRRRGEVSLR